MGRHRGWVMPFPLSLRLAPGRNNRPGRIPSFSQCPNLQNLEVNLCQGGWPRGLISARSCFSYPRRMWKRLGEAVALGR